MKRYVIMILMCLTTLACNDKLTELEVVEFGAALVDGTTVPFNYKAGQFDIQIVSDGEFDAERVFVGAIVPMNTADGQIINAQIAEITKDKVTIDLNHPLAGENLHFVGKVLNIREVTEGELKALHHRGCGGCGGHCGGGDCSDCGEGGCGGNCHC